MIQPVKEPSLLGFELRPRVECHQGHNQRIHIVGGQPSGAIQSVKAGVGGHRPVADVVQPRCADQWVVRSQPADLLSAFRHPLHVQPAFGVRAAQALLSHLARGYRQHPLTVRLVAAVAARGTLLGLTRGSRWLAFACPEAS